MDRHSYIRNEYRRTPGRLHTARNIIVAASAVLAAAACALAQDLPRRRLAAGDGAYTLHSGFDEARRAAVRDAATWAVIWQELQNERRPIPPVPEIDFDGFSSSNVVAGLVLATIHADGAGTIEHLDLRAREVLEALRQKEVQPGSSIVRPGQDFHFG